jgi:prepilin-type N-terminal cleavage/methylation domain-containing protein
VTSRRYNGFTLIEVLVVVLLASILITLVAPIGVEQVGKARAQTEFLELDRQIGRLSLDAFTRSDFVTLQAAGKRLAWEFEGGGRGAMVFEQLFFDAEQQVIINPNGIADPQVLELLQRDRSRTLEMLP